MSVVIQKTCFQQSDTNVALLNAVSLTKKANYMQLFNLFGDHEDGEVKAHERFNAKLAYLCFTKQLVLQSGRRRERVFALGAEAGKLGGGARWKGRYQAPGKANTAAPRPAQAPKADLQACGVEPAEDLPAWVAQPAPPSRIDLMSMPAYVPSRGPALRRGALDYQRHASFGDRC